MSTRPFFIGAIVFSMVAAPLMVAWLAMCAMPAFSATLPLV